MTPRLSIIAAAIRKIFAPATSTESGDQYWDNVVLAMKMDTSTSSVDPYWSDVTAALRMDGTDGAAVFQDLTGKAVSVNGNTVTKTATKKFGTSSAYFDGDVDGLTYSSTDFGHDTYSTPFTVEAWVNFSSWAYSGYQERIFCWTGTNHYFNVSINDTGVVSFWVQVSPRIASPALSLNTWYHIALTCNGAGNYKLFIDGVSAGSWYDSSSWLAGNTTFAIGRNPGFDTSNYSLHGYVDDFRYTVGVNRYPSNFTPPTAAFPDGVSPFIDEKGHTVTANGNAVIQSTTKKYGTGAAYFDGSGDYALVTLDGGLGSGDFTVEYWVYSTLFYDYITHVCNTRGGTGFNAGTQGAAQIVWYSSGTEKVRGSTSMQPNTWYHVAFVRKDGVLKGYLNGAQDGTYSTETTNFSDSSWNIGRLSGGSEYMAGYIDDLRITKGVARYTSDFTPKQMETGPYVNTAVQYSDPFWSNVVLAMHADAGWDDGDPYWDNVVLSMPMNGTNGATTFIDGKGHTAVAHGNIQISTAQSRFGGSSAYFDGLGDYLEVTTPDIQLGTSSFTLDCYVYLTGYADYRTIFDSRESHGSTTGFVIGVDSAGRMYLYTNGTFRIQEGSVPLNKWNHIAFVRDGNTFIIYVNGVALSTTYTWAADLTRTTGLIGASWPTDSYWVGYIDDFRITKGVARYTSTFNPPIKANPTAGPTTYDPFADKVVLAMHMDGADNSTTFTDQCGTTLSKVGVANISTALSRFGSSSLYLWGGAVVATDTTVTGFGTGDFTIEFWLNYKGGAGYVCFFNTNTGSGNYIYYGLQNGTKNPFIWNNGNVVIASSTITNDVWQHHAVVRSGGVVSIYLDGVMIGSSAWAADLGATRNIIIGAADTGGSSQGTAGYIDDFRITKGVARYTANFSVPTKAFPNPFTDLKGKIPVAYGNTSLSTTQSKFGGKAMYFDGTVDYLTINSATDFEFGSGAFTIEFFYRPQAVAAYSAILVLDEPDFPLCVYHGSSVNSGNPSVSIGPSASAWFTGASAMSLGAVTNGVWYHIAIVRSGDTFIVFKDGVITAYGTTDSAGQSVGSATAVALCKNATHHLTCYIDDLRITKGVARYTTDFVPPNYAFEDVAETDPYLSSTVLHLPMNYVGEDKYWDSVTLAMPMDGPNASTSFYDAKGKTVTVFGNAQISTAQSKFGGASAYFDGSGDYLTLPSSVDLDMSGDVTIEAWVNITSLASARYILSSNGGGAPNYFSDCLYVTTSGALGFALTRASNVSTNTSVVSSAGAVSTGVWQHIVAVKSGLQAYLFVNGSLVHSGTFSENAAPGSTRKAWIGAYWNAIEGFMLGYIDDLRITKGVARYTASFTPPTKSFFAIEDKRGKPVTVNGDVKMTKAAQKYGWGSGYFDGTGDYLSIPASADLALDQDFTIEAWLLLSAAPSISACVFTTGSNYGVNIGFNSARNLIVSHSNVVVLLTSSFALATGTWYYVTVTRSGTSLRLYLNGVLDGTVTSSASFNGSGPAVGTEDTNYFNGYIQDLRVTKGVARYLTNFDVPKRPLPKI